MFGTNGNLITVSIADRKQNRVWNCIAKDPDASLPGHTKAEGRGAFAIQKIIHHPNKPDHLEVSVTAQMGTLEVRRLFVIYTNVAAINCTFFFRGQASQAWKETATALAASEVKGIESQKNLNTSGNAFPVMDNLRFSGNHWKANAVEFFDVTDYNNTLVKQSYQAIFCCCKI